MVNIIKVYSPTKRAYGNEYPVSFIKNGKVLFKTVVFGLDLKDIKRAYTKEFESAKVIRTYLKK